MKQREEEEAEGCDFQAKGRGEEDVAEGGRRLRSRAYGRRKSGASGGDWRGEREGWGCAGCLGNSRELLHRWIGLTNVCVHALRDSRVNVSTLGSIGTTDLQRLSQAHAALDVDDWSRQQRLGARSGWPGAIGDLDVVSGS